jgi:hypothetical protein
MLGNDNYGDCVAVTWANMRRLVTATLTTEYYPDLNQVIELYKTQNPGFPSEDDGMDIQTCLNYLNKTGSPDGVKSIAFARINYHNIEEVKAALAIFGCLWVGINVRAINETQFHNNQPWDYNPNSHLEGCHSILTGGYLGVPTSDVTFITWAKETSFTDNFWGHDVFECWVVIWPEHLGTEAFQEGVDLETLAADYLALTGRELVIPDPIPPIPPPPPTPPCKCCVVKALRWLKNKIA